VLAAMGRLPYGCRSVDDERRVPQGRIGRLARLAAMGVKTGAGALLDRSGAGSANHAAEVLGTLRGLAAKVGQMASYVDGVIPEGQRAAYEASMKALQSAAPRSSAVEIRACVEAELGAPIDRLFTRWSDEPLASASIGQVHVAELPDGREVAVKVQHPGVVQAVESDLANAGILEGFVGALGGKRFETKKMFAVVRARFREELDYELEASRLSRFAELHAGDPTVRVPRLVPSHSARRVLTTELARGWTFDEACAAPVEARTAWAETMWRFVFKGTLRGSMLNADPHPGNYIFHPDGVVTFLDYGCVQEVEEGHRQRAEAVHRAALARDEPRFGQAVAALVKSRPGALEKLAIAYSRKCFEPLFHAPYHIRRSYAASLVDEMKDMAQAARKVPTGEFFAMPPDMLFVNRLQFGFYSVLARLDVDVDYAAVERGFLATAQDAVGFAAASGAPRAPTPATRAGEGTPRTRSA
jgi:predicted unusual protein kinase regulating ubiquinone biosynthesis (AarF/ABC1/UbiB family)